MRVAVDLPLAAAGAERRLSAPAERGLQALSPAGGSKVAKTGRECRAAQHQPWRTTPWNRTSVSCVRPFDKRRTLPRSARHEALVAPTRGRTAPSSRARSDARRSRNPMRCLPDVRLCRHTSSVTPSDTSAHITRPSGRWSPRPFSPDSAARTAASTSARQGKSRRR